MKKIPYCFNFYFTQKPAKDSLRHVFQINIRTEFMQFLRENDEALMREVKGRVPENFLEPLYTLLVQGQHPHIPSFRWETNRPVHDHWEFELEVCPVDDQPGKQYLQDEAECLGHMLEFLSLAAVAYAHHAPDQVTEAGSLLDGQRFLFENHTDTGYPLHSVELAERFTRSLNFRLGPVDEKLLKSMTYALFSSLFEDELVRFDMEIVMRPGFVLLRADPYPKPGMVYIDASLESPNAHLSGWRIEIEPGETAVDNLLLLAGIGILFAKAQDLLLRPC